MTTMPSVPQYVAPNRQATLTVNLTESGSNFVRIWCTHAPPGSSLRQKLDDSNDPRNRVLFYDGKGGETAKKQATFEVGGVYTFTAQEYDRGASDFGGGYQGDPDGDLTSTPVGSPSTITFYVGERHVSTIRAGADSVDLVTWTWDDTIQATSRGLHGEESPAVIKAGPTARELAAIESSAVSTAATALAGTTVSAALGSFGAPLSNFISKWNAHLADGTVHEDADAVNVIPVGLSSASSAKGLKQAINEILPRVRNHYTNDAAYGGTSAGRDTGNYHNVVTKRNDNLNLPIIDGVASDADAYWAQAELWRSYEAHRVSAPSSGVHDSADSTNSLTALPAMLAVAKEVFTVWAASSPVAPVTASSASTLLVAQAGFRVEPLS